MLLIKSTCRAAGCMDSYVSLYVCHHIEKPIKTCNLWKWKWKFFEQIYLKAQYTHRVKCVKICSTVFPLDLEVYEYTSYFTWRTSPNTSGHRHCLSEVPFMFISKSWNCSGLSLIRSTWIRSWQVQTGTSRNCPAHIEQLTRVQQVSSLSQGSP